MSGVNVPEHFYTQFATIIKLKLQQPGRLRDTVTVGTHSGEKASPVDQVGAIEMQEVTGRFKPMGRVDSPLDRRWVYPTGYDLPQLIDTFDKLQLLLDPTSTYVANAMMAAERTFDRLILAAARGTNKTGKEGQTSTVLPNAQKIGVAFGASGNVGLTAEKIIEGKTRLMEANVDLDNDPIYLPIGARQHGNLLREIRIVSKDFNDEPVLVEGKVKRWLGVNFIHTELNEVAGGNIMLPMYAKSGMHLGIWEDIMTDVDQRKDLQGLPFQAYVKLMAGATRTEEKKIIEIACAV